MITSQEPADLPEQARHRDVEILRLPLRSALADRDAARFVRVRHEVARLKERFQPDLIHLNGVTPSVLFHLQTRAAHPAAVLVRMNQELPGPARLDTLIALLCGRRGICCGRKRFCTRC